MRSSCPRCGRPLIVLSEGGKTDETARSEAVRHRGTCRVPCPHCGAVVR